MEEIQSKEGYVLYLDLVDSRRQVQAELVLQKERGMIHALLECFGSDFIFEPHRVKGLDEIEMGFKDIKNLVPVVMEIERWMHPFAFRYYLVFGTMNILHFEGKFQVMGGEVFHDLNNRIDWMKHMDLIFFAEHLPKNRSHVLNGIFNMWLQIEREKTDRQLQISHLLRQGFNYTEIAGQLKISIPGVKKIADQAKWKINSFSEKEIQKYIMSWT